MKNLRILVADDHEVVRRGLCTLLEAQPEWQVCGEAGDGREVVAKTAEQSNRRLEWLTIMTALFLPPTLITGVYGMNLKGLPLTDIEEGGLCALLICILSSAAAFRLIHRKIRRADN